MPSPASRVAPRTGPHWPRPTLVLLATAMLMAPLLLSCSGGAGADAEMSAPAASASPTPSLSFEPAASGDLGPDLCDLIGEVEAGLDGFNAVELRVPNQTELDIELGTLQAAFADLRQADLGDLSDRLDEPLTRLGYRLDELDLAVEDFRTNPRPRRAIPHVEEKAGLVADAIATVAIFARC